MLFNIFVLFTISIISYYGYKYKALIIFIASILLKDSFSYFNKLKIPKCVLNEKTQTYVLNFLLNNEKYTLTIPIEQIYNTNDKLLCLSSNTNCTKKILKVIGPNGNFFGFNITPANLGLDKLTIWKHKTRYIYDKDSVINFDDSNKVDETSSSSSDDE